MVRKPLCPIRIAIVVNEQAILEQLRKLFQAADGFEVIAAALNGQLLVEELLAQPLAPDLIFTDMPLRVPDGAATTRRLLEEYTRATVVGFYTPAAFDVLLPMVVEGCHYFVAAEQAEGLLKAMEYLKSYYGYELNLYSGYGIVAMLFSRLRQEGAEYIWFTVFELELVEQLAQGKGRAELLSWLELEGDDYEGVVLGLYSKLSYWQGGEWPLRGLRQALSLPEGGCFEAEVTTKLDQLLGLMQQSLVRVEAIEEPTHLAVMYKEEWLQLPLDKIRYVENAGKYSKVYVEKELYYMYPATLTELIRDHLDERQFAQTSRRLVIPLFRVKGYDKRELWVRLADGLSGAEVLEGVGKGYMKELIRRLGLRSKGGGR